MFIILEVGEKKSNKKQKKWYFNLFLLLLLLLSSKKKKRRRIRRSSNSIRIRYIFDLYLVLNISLYLFIYKVKLLKQVENRLLMIIFICFISVWKQQQQQQQQHQNNRKLHLMEFFIIFITIFQSLIELIGYLFNINFIITWFLIPFSFF